jgi:hypothetical protein
MKKADVQVSQLVDMKEPSAVFEEVKYNFIQHYPFQAFAPVRYAFNDFNDLFEGRYTGYRACNTKFHDKIHTSDALLAISRLIDGYNLTHTKIPVHDIQLALIATIFHDTGYIQSRHDKKGTGAKYTLSHVERSIDFMKKYFEEQGFSRNDFLTASKMVNCTGLSVNIDKMKFGRTHEKVLGFMLGTADLLGQMASRTYLERLIYLYREFREGHVKGYTSEFNLLQKTLKFYDEVKKRIESQLGGVSRYARVHFRKRYGVDEDLYQKAIVRQMKYLTEILQEQAQSYRDKLKRQI